MGNDDLKEWVHKDGFAEYALLFTAMEKRYLEVCMDE